MVGHVVNQEILVRLVAQDNQDEEEKQDHLDRVAKLDNKVPLGL